jgi:hypothetical protein
VLLAAPIRDAHENRAPTIADYDELLARFDAPFAKFSIR